MNIDIQPDRDLTEEEELLAELTRVAERIPCGFQIGMPMHLARAMALVEQLFSEHDLPYKDELLGHLRLWKEHSEQGVTYSQQCDDLMHQVFRSVDTENTKP